MTPGRILVVEDDPLSLMLVRDLMQHRGHWIDTAASIPEARILLRTARPDLLLLDAQVPGGGGETLLGEVRADPALAHLPVLVVTAQSMHGDRERLLAAGFNGYLSKPIDVRTFAQVVEGFLEKG